MGIEWFKFSLEWVLGEGRLCDESIHAILCIPYRESKLCSVYLVNDIINYNSENTMVRNLIRKTFIVT